MGATLLTLLLRQGSHKLALERAHAILGCPLGKKWFISYKRYTSLSEGTKMSTEKIPEVVQVAAPQPSAVAAKTALVKPVSTAKTVGKAKPSAKSKAKPAVKSAAKPAAKPVAKPASKPAARKPAVTAAAKAAKAKLKLVRDSFTMPKADFDLINVLKERALNSKRPAKKSELLRAGLYALAALTDAQLLARLDKLAALKPGRPKNAV
jgi:hypothetical protein